ncbi:uncharacterized protein LOC133289133 isoform X2 [Gastrolobium bilobum]|uniref:uncharacterized protein LOC133289133 isoform X2 n=1 Tax=Gastrolobium bilobum TaxID=150636 RepID=UPI002AB0FF2D|nr:uncharacterized protein LOC133289133 isoform X2 [Gastrolobium bilobum]
MIVAQRLSMPGNEAGDRVHNFFGQENLSQGQYHSQAVDGNWPGLSNNLWASNQRSAGVPFISNVKNFNLQQSDSEQGHTSSPHLRHGFNMSQSNFRPESTRNQLSNQRTAVNGYMQGQQVFQTRQNEANILGVDTESDWQSLSRGIPVLESQGSGLELYKKNLVRNDVAESPVNFDFFGGQQQISGRHGEMLQPLPRQQSGMNEMHLLQQQAMLNQMQELQRQQQFHQLEAKQQSSITPASSISKQTVTTHSGSLINGIPVNEASNLAWQPEVVPANANWLQRGASPVMHGSSNGLMLSPDQGQALRLMGLVPNHGDQSLYGVPISGSRGTPNLYGNVQADKPAVSQFSIPHQYSHVHGDKSALANISASGNSFPAHQYDAFSDQTNTNDGTLVSRQDIQGKSVFSSTAHGVNSGLNMENLQQVNSEQRIVPMQDFHGRQELDGSSEMSQDKMLVQAPPSQNVATLDPTEEKILFGSDDSLWDGFSRNTGGFNMLDGTTDSFSGFPSIQSGSWSALMQSAVAETSNSDMGIQEEWSGLSVWNKGCSSGNDRPSTTDSSKQQSVWTDNNLQSASNINSRPFLRPDDVNRPNTTENCSGVSRFHQSGPDCSHEQHDRLQTDSQRPISQFLERGKWLDCSPQQKQLLEGGHIYGNAANSSGSEKNEKVISGSWTHQQTISSRNSSGGPFNKSNGWDVMKSTPFDSSSTFKTHENENSLQAHHGKAMHEEMGHVPAMWEPESDTNSSGELEHVKSAGNMQVCGEDSGMNGIAALPNSGTAWISRQSSKQLPSVDVWRDAESEGSYRRNEVLGNSKHHMEKNPLVLESSKNGKVEGEAHDMENSNKKEKSADGLGSNPSHPRAGGMRENTGFDGNDLCSPKLSGQGNRRPPVTRKFQYHPMGDLGVELESYGNKHVINSQPMAHQPFGGHKEQDQSYLGQSKYGHSDGNYSETEKGGSKSLGNNALKTILPGHMPKTLTSLDRSIGNFALQKTASPRVSENESSDGSVVHPQRNRSSLSQGFGLQLAPPTQWLPMVPSRGSSETGLTMPHVSETGDKGHTWLATNQSFPSQESSHRELRNNISSTTGNFFDKASQYSMLGNTPRAFTPGLPFSRILTQNQNIANLGGQVTNTQSANATFVDCTASMNQINEYCERAQTSQSELASAQDVSQLSGIDQIRVGDPAIQILAVEAGTQPSVTFSASLHGAPSKVLHNVWTSVSSKEHPNTSNIPLQPQQISDCKMTTGVQKPGDEGSEKDGNDLSGIGPFSVYSNSSVGNLLQERSGQQKLPESAVEKAAGASHVKEPVAKCTSDAPQPSPIATSRDIEAFGRSLRPNNVLNQNFSLLDQVQSMRNVVIDPGNQDVKRLKVSDNVVDKQQVDSNRGLQLSYGYDNVVKDVSGNNCPTPSSDPNMIHFSTKTGDGQDTNTSSQEVVGYCQKNALNVSDSSKATSEGSDHSLVNPQMAPSWFEQYGTFKNGKILPMYDARKMTASKIMDHPSMVQNQSNSLHFHNSIEQVSSLSDDQLGNARQSPMPASVASEHVHSQLSTPAVEPDLLIMRPKKRKSATSELLPWHKELTQGSERLRNISVAELDWARTANRLIEKVEEDAEAVEDLPAMVKSKRRLVLTTQLMQQLLSPPPAAVFVADVKLHHESVIYSVARLALGDACSSISWSGCDALLPPGTKNPLHEKRKSSDKIDHYILKVMDLVGRARKLEDDILRLDSRASILDLRVECQDLERFSVINRFAKFHGRGQNDGVETSSSSDASANAQKSFPLKYVNAIPLPRNLPHRVQCLSL